MWRAIRLYDLISNFAEEAGKLSKDIIDLFQASSGDMTSIWSQLSTAYDFIADSAENLKGARQRCTDADAKCSTLLTMTGVFEKQLHLSKSSHKLMVDKDDMEFARNLILNVNALVDNCISEVETMSLFVKKGINKMPDKSNNSEGTETKDEAGMHLQHLFGTKPKAE
eukprot:11715689-Ditylum_brightwellii.AAC.1